MKSIKQPYYMLVIILFCLFMLLPIKSQAAENDATLINGDGFANAIYKVVQATSKSYTDVQHIVYDATPSTEILNATSYEVVSESGPEIRMCFISSTGTIHIYPIAPVDVIYLNENATHMFSYYVFKPTFHGYYGLSSCQDIDTSWFDTSKVTTMNSMFYGCQKLTSLDVSGFDTTNVTNMDSLFSRCFKLTSLDFSGFDTSNVTNMYQMFNDCRSLTNLDVSGFDTSKVTNMYRMFYNCSSLVSLDVSGFNTANVANMSGMFNGCSSLTSLDVGRFDTANVTSMKDMFECCSSLTSLDVSGFDTSKVTTMGAMFYGCSKLTSLDASNFGTENVTDMSSMFSGCSALTNLNVSGFDTSKVTNMKDMFYHCSALTSLGVSNFNTVNVTNMFGMFSGCSSLTSLDLSGLDTSNVTDMSYMFYNCSKLINLDVGGFDTSKVTTMGNMFTYCSSLTNLDVSGFSTANVANMGSMFSSCSSLTSLDVSSFDTANVTYMSYMFSSSSSLTDLNVSGLDTSKVQGMSYMFSDCSSLTGLDVSSFDTANVIDMSYMFNGCSSLTSLDVSSFDTAKVTNMSYMFSNCSSLTTLDLSSFDTSNIVKSLFVDIRTCLYNCANLTQIHSPKTIMETTKITLPAKEGCAWYLDDEEPKLEADSELTYTYLISGTENTSHSYIRSDNINFMPFNPLKRATNPAEISMPVTMDVDAYYEVSVPALLEFTPANEPIFYPDTPEPEYRTYHLIDDKNEHKLLDTANTYYCTGDIGITGSGTRDLKITITPPIMQNDEDCTTIQLYDNGQDSDRYIFYDIFGIDEEFVNASDDVIAATTPQIHQFCLENNICDPYARFYFYSFLPEQEVYNATRAYYNTFEYNDGHLFPTALSLSRCYTPDKSFSSLSPINGLGWHTYFVLRGEFNKTGTYTGNMSVDFKLE